MMEGGGGTLSEKRRTPPTAGPETGIRLLSSWMQLNFSVFRDQPNHSAWAHAHDYGGERPGMRICCRSAGYFDSTDCGAAETGGKRRRRGITQPRAEGRW